MTAQEFLLDLETFIPLQFGKYYCKAKFQKTLVPSILLSLADITEVTDLNYWNAKHNYKIFVYGFDKDGGVPGTLELRMTHGKKSDTKWADKKSLEPSAAMKYLKEQLTRIGALFRESNKEKEVEAEIAEADLPHLKIQMEKFDATMKEIAAQKLMLTDGFVSRYWEKSHNSRSKAPEAVAVARTPEGKMLGWAGVGLYSKVDEPDHWRGVVQVYVKDLERGKGMATELVKKALDRFKFKEPEVDAVFYFQDFPTAGGLIEQAGLLPLAWGTGWAPPEHEQVASSVVEAAWKFCTKCVRMTEHDNGECKEHQSEDPPQETEASGDMEKARKVAEEIREALWKSPDYKALNDANMAQFGTVKWDDGGLIVEIEQPEEKDFKLDYDRLDDKKRKLWENMENLSGFLFSLKEKTQKKHKWLKDIIICERASFGKSLL